MEPFDREARRTHALQWVNKQIEDVEREIHRIQDSSEGLEHDLERLRWEDSALWMLRDGAERQWGRSTTPLEFTVEAVKD